MPIGKPRKVDGLIDFSSRNAIRLLLVSSMLGLQGDEASNKGPYEGWDDLKYLYEDIDEAVPDQPPTLPSDQGNGSDGFDLLREPNCDEDTCKFG